MSQCTYLSKHRKPSKPALPIKWTPNVSAFYIDGVQRARHTTNVRNYSSWPIHISVHGCTQVPTNGGSWIWNAWSSGDPCWSSGPPLAESVTQIKSIEIFKGYAEGADNTSTTSNCVSGTPVPQPTHAVALSPSPAVAKSEAIQTVSKCVFPSPSHLETLLKY